MSFIPKALLSFKKKSSTGKISFGESVINALTAILISISNPFTALPLKIADLQALNDALSDAAVNMENGGKSASIAMKAAVAAWNDGFTLTANYVSLVAANSPATSTTIINQAGFVPSKATRSAKPKPGALDSFTATINGKKGAIISKVKAATYATGYVMAATPASATVAYEGDTMIITMGGQSIYIAAGTNKDMEMYNLPGQMVYNVNMYAFNSTGSGPASTDQVTPQ
jgi:hypothetical protein